MGAGPSSLARDFAYAAEMARFALSEITLGIIPGTGGTQTLPRAVDGARARELILTGRAVSAREAATQEIVNAVHAPDALLTAIVDTIVADAPLAVRQTKHAIRRGADLDLRSALMFEIEA